MVWVSSYEHYTDFCYGGTTLTQAPTFVESTKSNTISKGPNYHDWRYRLANSLQCTTFLSGIKYARSHNVAHFHAGFEPKPGTNITCAQSHYISGNHGVISGVANLPIGKPDASDPTLITVADNKAKALFVQKLRETQTTFQGGVFVGELKETLHLLVSPAKTLREGLSAYLGTLKKRRRQVRKVSPKRRLSVARRVIADTWLEYAFGWRPLLADINDACKTLAAAQASIHETWRPVSARGRDDIRGSGSQQVFGVGGLSVYAVYDTLNRKEVVYRGSVGMSHVQPGIWRHSGFSLEDFVPTVWELIPYSFLVDYFTNIDDIISAATYLSSNIRWMNRTQVEFASSEVKSTLAVPSGSIFFNSSAWCSPIKEQRSRVAFSRDIYTGSLIPSLNFNIPGFGTKWINMAALAFGNRALVPFHR